MSTHDHPDSIGYEDREYERQMNAAKKTKKERIAELETLLGVLEHNAKRQRLIVLLDRPGKDLTVVLDKHADDYTIEADNDYVPGDPRWSPILMGGTITIRWH